MGENSQEQSWRDVWMTSRDGLRLYGRHYAAPQSKRRPVICLAGLTRNSRDFHVIAEALCRAGDKARDVYSFDCRGRGWSENASNWKDYAVPVEMLDVQDFMASQHLHDAAIIGTSRGGLIAMVLAAAQPSLIGAVVLNDVGPVINYEGLVRIAAYVGKTPTPRTWEDAAQQVEAANAALFPAVAKQDWVEIARQFYNDKDGRPAVAYDPELANSFSVKDDAIPELWPQFMALKRVPCLVVRGDKSDLLSAETVAEMQSRHPSCRSITVEGEGHAPLLRDTPTIEVVRDFLVQAD